VKANSKIHVLTGAEITKIDGFIGNYKTTVVAGGQEQQFSHGVVLVATGAYELETKEYGYGTSEAIVAQRDLERMIHDKDYKWAPPAASS